MIIILRSNSTDDDIHAVEQKIRDMGLEPHVSKGVPSIMARRRQAAVNSARTLAILRFTARGFVDSCASSTTPART